MRAGRCRPGRVPQAPTDLPGRHATPSQSWSISSGLCSSHGPTIGAHSAPGARVPGCPGRCEQEEEHMTRARRVAAGAALVALAAGSLGVTASAQDPVTLTYLVDSTAANLASAQALADAFTAQNPNVTITIEPRPQGGEGDN